MSLKIFPKKDAGWQVKKTGNTCAYAAGYGFVNGRYTTAGGMAEFFIKNTYGDLSAFCDLVKSINGNFALIVSRECNLFAAVDRVRSHPIFYCFKDGTLYIGDDVNSIKNAAGRICAGPQAAEEYLMSGYVSGGNTLCDEIKGLQAGECLGAKSDETEICRDIALKRYYLYYNAAKLQQPPASLINTHDRIVENAFKRIAESAGGRKLVIPLSGGVDSRLVASMFKRIGHKNILCISYGIPGNWETKISRAAADKLGYEWIFMPYSREKWRDISKSGEWHKFFYSFNNISSVPNVNEWLAVSGLKKDRIIPDDAVFVPGHTGDFISGGHIHYVFDEKTDNITIDGLSEKMLRKHYALWPLLLKDPQIKKRAVRRLSESFKNFRLESAQSIIDAYECWEWQERQAKFIVNSARVYDFWGYEWRIPLWDSELMDFWSAVPYKLKLRKKLYLDYLEKTDRYGIFGNNLRRNKLYRKRILPGALRSLLQYFRDTIGIYGIYGYFVSTFLNAGKRSINSIFVKDYLRFFRRNNTKDIE
ncbi:MAG: asparagine synthase-related protein [Candidatus Omnitrophica bacterium]|nr:asparagine synthase-related protein [Candidatus Omnitrophota bacterium]